MNVYVNMVTQQFGTISADSLIIYHLQPWSKTKSSAYMAAFHLVLTPLIKSNRLIVSKKYPMKDRTTISSGMILMKEMVGDALHV